MPSKPEAFSRILIDQALKDSDWDLLDDRRVRFELDGKSGRADYVLCSDPGSANLQIGVFRVAPGGWPGDLDFTG